MKAFLLLVFWGISLGTAALAEDAILSSPRLTPVVKAVQAVMPAVVNISTERVLRVADPYESYFNRFFAPNVRYFTESIPLGSGIVVDRSGLVLTNYHVIQRASKIMVRLYNHEMHTGTVVAYDMDNDLCLLQLEDLDDDSLTAIEFALPDDLYLGETVVAVGNPFGLEHSVAQGVLSAKNRSLREGEVVFDDILQTDAAINPGNSGGPLINMDGHLIGMNLAIRRDSEGIGFAIPLRRIEAILAQWLVPSKFSDGYCGFACETSMEAGVPSAVVTDVWDASPAAEAGLKRGDVIRSVNGASVTRAVDVGRRIWQLQPGEALRLTCGDGRQLRLAVEGMGPAVLARRRLGIQVQPLNRALRRALNLPADLNGLAITEVFPESEFAKRRVRWSDMGRRGDIVLQVNGISTPTVEALSQALSGTRGGARASVVLLFVDAVGAEISLSPMRVEITLN